MPQIHRFIKLFFFVIPALRFLRINSSRNIFFAYFFFLVACSGSNSNNDNSVKKDSTAAKVIAPKVSNEEAVIIEPAIDNEIKTYTKDGISLVEIKAKEFSNTLLSISTKQFKEGTNSLSFLVEGISNYNIAILENNYTLTYFNQPNIKKEFLYGNNVFLAFLTDENNISIKKNNAHLLKNVVIGDMDVLFNMGVPHLFFYLPQPTSAQPILDFYLVNTSIAENGNKVKVTINSIEFIIDKWAAYTIKGLTKAENTIRIQLIDKNGNLIDGPFNDSGDRSFVVSKTS
ncbi:MAG: hypothetical protein HYU68_12690 [Bacteroidetes bacterium]|nr:hypothetical protein [Bacteroidota bacterium]